MAEGPTITPVILSGGAGTRLWPMSRESFPKQFLPLASEQSMLQQTALRVATSDGFAPPIVVCNVDHRFMVAEQLRTIDIDPRAIVLEPVGRNTAPAAAIAALMLAEKDPGALLLLLPSDHIVADKAGFLAAIDTAKSAATAGEMITFGVKPERAETGYGYIHRGSELNSQQGVFRVSEFVEKPNSATAEKYLSGGLHDWNSGMFLFAAETYLNEIERLEPKIIASCREAIEKAVGDLDFLRLDPESFSASPAKSIDYAVMEHTDKAAVVPVEIGWNDVGSWTALWDIGDGDDDGNVVHGDVLSLDCAGSYIRTDGPLVAALGIQDLVLVAMDDCVLVTPRDRAQDVKAVVDE